MFGSLLDGIFEGKIISPSAGSYYVEKASRYFPPESLKMDNGSTVNFHSVVYKETDVENPYENHETGTFENLCSSFEKYRNTSSLKLITIYDRESL